MVVRGCCRSWRSNLLYMEGVTVQKKRVSKCASGYGANSRGFSCGVCSHFMPPNACAIVEGEIKPADCCNLFDSLTFRSPCKRRRR